MGWFGGSGGKNQQKSGTEQKDGVVTKGGDQTTAPGGKAESVDAPRQQQQQQQTGPSSTDVSVFEFGSAQVDGDERLTLAGYCPVSDEMEPCRWEVLPAGQTEAPGFRILF